MDEQKEHTFKIPSEWIDRIFKRLDECFGDKFLSHFKDPNDFNLERLRWQSALYGATADEIKHVLDMCRTGLVKSAPNCIEFYHLCKGFKEPPKQELPDITKPVSEVAKQYLKLIRDKLHGRSGAEGEAALSALDQQVLANKPKEEPKPTHWTDNYG